MFSLETRLAQTSEFKEALLHATSPLEFARGHIRQNGDVQNRSQAAHVGDRLKVVDDVLTSLLVRGLWKFSKFSKFEFDMVFWAPFDVLQEFENLCLFKKAQIFGTDFSKICSFS